jgi:hypothetical protein
MMLVITVSTPLRLLPFLLGSGRGWRGGADDNTRLCLFY